MKRDKDGTNKRRECGWIRKENKRKEKEREKGEETRERERNKKGDFLGIPTIESRQFESKSRSTHRGLRLGTKILEFRQTPRGKKFSYLDYF